MVTFGGTALSGGIGMGITHLEEGGKQWDLCFSSVESVGRYSGIRYHKTIYFYKIFVLYMASGAYKKMCFREEKEIPANNLGGIDSNNRK